MKRLLTTLVLTTFIFSCSENNNLTPEKVELQKDETTKLPESLNELLAQNSTLSYQKLTVKSDFDNSTLDLFIASTEKEYLNNFLLSYSPVLSKQSNELVRTDDDTSFKNEVQKIIEEKPTIYILAGESNYKDQNIFYSFSFIKNKNAKARAITTLDFNIEVQSNNYDDYIGVTRSYSSGSPSDLAVFFYIKHGWLGEWYYASSYTLTGDNEYKENCNESVRRHKAIIYHNFYNYSYSYGNKSCN
jgi:hypothetical protein